MQNFQIFQLSIIKQTFVEIAWEFCFYDSRKSNGVAKWVRWASVTFLIRKTLTNKVIKKMRNELAKNREKNFGFQFVAIKNNDERPKNDA